MAFAITRITLVDETGGHNAAGVYYERRYQVEFSGGYSAKQILYTTFTDGTAAPANVGTLPKYFDAHPDDSAAYAAEISVKLAEGDGANMDPSAAGVADYLVKYAQKKIDYDPNPLNRPAVIEWGGTDLTEVPLKDVTDKALVNSAGELYDGLPERPIRGASEFTITKNESANPGQNIEDFSYTTNQAAFNGIPIGNAMIGKITASKYQEVVNGSTVTYWKVTYPIRRRKDGWNLKIFDAGWTHVVSGASSTITDAMGLQPTKPVLLDGSGGQLAVGGTPVYFPTVGYVLLTASDWSTLSLPNPFA